MFLSIWEPETGLTSHLGGLRLTTNAPVTGSRAALSDFFASEAVEVTEHHHLAAAFGQREDGIEEKFEPAFLLEGFACARSFVEQAQSGDLRNRLVGQAAPPPEKIDGAVARGGEEKGFGVGDAAAFVGAQRADVRFLDKVVVIRERRKAFLQIRPQGRFVGLNVRGEPTGPIGWGHGVKRVF